MMAQWQSFLYLMSTIALGTVQGCLVGDYLRARFEEHGALLFTVSILASIVAAFFELYALLWMANRIHALFRSAEHNRRQS